MNTVADGIDAAAQYAANRRDHWDGIAARRQLQGVFSRCYHARLLEVFRGVVPPGMRVLEIGCGQGDLLAALRPAYGFGVDFSAEMLKLAEASHPQLRLRHADAHDLSVIDERFDYVILSTW
jgi:ubiquinone/menaquinone biosynthesis C-methylase UbiE